MYSDFFVNEYSKIIDIGCSAGTFSREFLQWHKDKSNIQLSCLDVSSDMINNAKELCKDDSRVEYLCTNAFEYDFSNSDLIFMFYTLQFIPSKVRQELINKIYKELNWGGAVLIFEKVRAPDARFQDINNQIYVDFKLLNGFTEEEIINKSRSLKNVLDPFSSKGNIELFQRAGFIDINTIFKWVCFEGFLLIK